MTAKLRSTAAAAPVPAVWAAFAAQGRWKNWVLIVQLFLILTLIYANTSFVKKEPDVVLVSPDGTSVYVERAMVGDSVIEAIHAAKGMPDELSVLRFSKDFVRLVLGVHSATVADSWDAAKQRMTLELRTKLDAEYKAQRVIETFELAKVRTDLEFVETTLLERTDKFLRVRSLVRRERSSLVDGSSPPGDSLHVELILQVVPRTPENPDGLAVTTFGSKPVAEPSKQAATDAVEPLQ